MQYKLYNNNNIFIDILYNKLINLNSWDFNLYWYKVQTYAHYITYTGYKLYYK